MCLLFAGRTATGRCFSFSTLPPGNAETNRAIAVPRVCLATPSLKVAWRVWIGELVDESRNTRLDAVRLLQLRHVAIDDFIKHLPE